MSTPQQAEQQIRKECQKLIEDLILYLLTIPVDWRYTRRTDWDIGQANSLKAYVRHNATYLFNKLQDPTYIERLAITEDHSVKSIVFHSALRCLLSEMFPTIVCLHADDLDSLHEKFTTRLVKIRSMFN